jgi:thiol-disulfide isomerase/thioredoxin
VTRRRAGAAALALSVAGLVAAGVVLARGQDRTAEPVPSATPATDAVRFSGPDPVTGKRVDLADYRGKPIVVNVWASWCAGCIEEAEALRAFAERHPEAQVIGVDIEDTKGGARAFYRRWGWRHPSVFDPRGEIAAELGLQGLPSTFFLDRRHRLATRIVGATDRAGFEAGLRQATST